MNIEQLKLILDTVERAGEGAWIIALIYFVKPYFTWTLSAAVIGYIARVITQAIAARGEAITFLQEVAYDVNADSAVSNIGSEYGGSRAEARKEIRDQLREILDGA